MPETARINALNLAASELSSSQGLSVEEQVLTVGNALVYGKRERQINAKVSGIPQEVCYVLENLKLQVSSGFIQSLNQKRNDAAFDRLHNTLIVVNNFVDQVSKYYKVEETALVKDVKKEFDLALADLEALITVRRLKKKIGEIILNYQDHPNMEQSLFCECLTPFEMELAAVKSQDREIHRLIGLIQSELDIAKRMCDLPRHPKKIEQEALAWLRISGEMLMGATNLFIVEKSLEWAKKGNEELEKIHMRETDQAIRLNEIIEANISSFIDRQLIKLEEGAKGGLYVIPNDKKSLKEVTEKLGRQKERLLAYYPLIIEWGGERKNDFLERLAILFEKIGGQARKGSELAEIIDFKEALNDIAQMGVDEVEPDKIFQYTGGTQEL